MQSAVQYILHPTKMASSSLPKTYKAALFKSKGAPLTVETLDLEGPKPGEILIKVKACGVCHTDWNAQNGDFGSPL